MRRWNFSNVLNMYSIYCVRQGISVIKAQLQNYGSFFKKRKIMKKARFISVYYLENDLFEVLHQFHFMIMKSLLAFYFIA